MAEQWRNIPEKDGYEISDQGRIRHVYQKHSRVLKPFDNGHGYKMISLPERIGRRNYYIHRLVAEAFVPKEPGRDYIHHGDHDRANNRADNLFWCTQKENVRQSAHLMRGFKGCKVPAMKGIRKRAGGYYEVCVWQKYLGRYKDLSEAQRVRDQYVQEVKERFGW